jgi:carbamoyl-phosphate synthase small subunit
MIPTQLVLATGERFTGLGFEWQQSAVHGEVVFNTGMVGYAECMTDPSYSGQILVFTYPLIGNYGVCPAERWESKKIQVSAVVMSQLAQFHARTQAEQSFVAWCQANNVPILTAVDTRAITKCLREHGVVPGIVTQSQDTQLIFPDVNQEHLVQKVSVKEPSTHGQGPIKIIDVDCGMKENIMRHLLNFPIEIKRVPFDYDFTAEDYDGIFISNGPGDPARCVETIAILQKALQKTKPIFGICLGAQLLSLAIGAKTYKLPFGHRGQNQPCLDLLTKRCYLTSQNHGFAVEEDTIPKDWLVRFKNLNDGTVQGIEHIELPFFAVQFHPEAAPGPEDTHFLFEQFYQALVKANKSCDQCNTRESVSA